MHDTFIADLAVATNAGQLKTGAPARGEVGDEGVVGLARAVADHAAQPGPVREADRAIDQVGTPVLNVLRPDRPDGSALILAPGGG